MPIKPDGFSVNSNGRTIIFTNTDKTPKTVVTEKLTRNSDGKFNSFKIEIKDKQPKK
jgi:hypothetical protein